MNKLIILGASGHGKVLADIAEKTGYEQIAFLDDAPDVKSCGAYPVVGKCGDASRFADADFIVAVGNAAIRRRLQTGLAEQGLRVVSLVHPAAVVAGHVSIGAGTAVMAGAVINPYVSIGEGCIINTCASVDHDCVLEDYVHVSVGAHVAGTVHVGSATWIGAGAVVSNNIDITQECMIGAGAVVVRNLVQSGTYIGVPARKYDRSGDAK